MTQPPQEPILMFANELLVVFHRWSEESDLEPLDMAEAAAIVINNFCNEDAIEFDPDPDMIDELEDM